MMRVWRLAVAILLGVLALPGNGVAQSQNGRDAVYETLNLFDEAFERIRQDSVDPVADSKLIGAAIAGMLSGLDPHAAYIDPTALKSSPSGADEDEPGIGLVVTIDNGELKVISPRDGSPAAKAGIEPGDLIFAIGKEPTYELTLAQAKEALHGPAGSAVTLTLRRSGGAPIRVTVKRTAYQLQTVSSRVLDGNIGYLRIAGFDDGTQAALQTALQDLRQRAGGKLAGLALDLRNNAGGNFETAVKVADAFVDQGDVAVIKGRDPANLKRIAGHPGDLAKGLPIVVIVNGGTAREAELVAGALQDDRRALLLGTRTYGDGDIETLIPLDSGGAIRLTTARFLTPAGHEIEGKGLAPDLVVTPVKLEKLAGGEGLHEADLPGALKNPDQPIPGVPVLAAPAAVPAGGAAPSAATPAHPPAPSVATGDIGSAGDEQLSAAVDILRGLAVFNPRASG
jgi:carboxyl-terminal processing protease